MIRRALVAAIAALVLTAVPVSAVKPIGDTATIAIDDPTPAYGQTIILTATVDAEGERTGMHTVCTHEFGQSQSDIGWHSESTYTDDVGLYAPNWPSGGADCVTSVLVWRAHGPQRVIGSLSFEVAA